MDLSWKFAKNTLLLTISVVYLTTCFMACSKDDEKSNNNSTEICQAILDDDQNGMLALMEELMMDLIPTSTATDPLGHEANYNELIDRLNDFSCMVAEGVCYGCIETFPVQSEIKLMVDLDGVEMERVLDIKTPDDGVLLYLRMHE